MFGRKKHSIENVTNETMLYKKLDFAATEAYKLLRTNLMFSLPDSDGCRIVGITSSVRGEGKSTTAANLSYALAENGKRVLLIDGDMRIPSIAKKLEINDTPGLSNLLIDNSLMDEAIVSMPCLENWHVLPSGNIPPNPTEMLNSAQMQNLMKTLAERYDFIIIDLPPVNLVSDALVVSPLLDGMLLVVRENFLERRELNKCVKRLELSSAKVLGFVFTVAREQTGRYRRYKRSRYYKSYYKKHKNSTYGYESNAYTKQENLDA